jgi:hypothetical protein
MIEIIFWSVLAAFMALGAITSIAMIGKPREPITPGVAVVNVLIAAGLAVGIVHYGILS